MLTPIRRSRSLTQDAYEHIKAAIIANELEPGYQLKEEELASQLGISSTPLREALAKLEQEWLVETLPHRGKFVAEISFNSVKEIFEIRRELEGLAVELAMSRLVEQDLQELETFFLAARARLERGDYDPSLWYESETHLHELIIDNSGNQWLMRLLGILNDHIGRIRGFRLANPGTGTRQSLQEHLAIWDAMQANDVPRARELMEQHLQKAGERLVKVLADNERKRLKQRDGGTRD